ncbi:Protein phosphatase 2C [Seminavis robusta]|uniref:Protein phosphatase 2C n=1 Tax=Seminavis robusta TaxID=568900 RepID=A0A9N8DQ72_9STRA|nr:Protein phosphatase 2C [Seminavis robusta]|eukprot:Sro180_g078810.1 Protein phosphatase 2C (973) ;mRNA; f:61752-64670
MASATSVVPHPVVNFGMASNDTNTMKVHAAPEEEAAAPLITTTPKAKKKNGVKATSANSRAKATRTTSVQTAPVEGENNKPSNKPKHKRSNSDTMGISSSDLSTASAPVTPTQKSENKLLRKGSLTPTTRGAHLKKGVQRVKRGNSFDGVGASSNSSSPKPEKPTMKKAPSLGQIKGKKKKDLVQQTTKRMSSSVSKLKAAKDLSQSVGRLSASTSKLKISKDLSAVEQQTAKWLAISLAKIKAANQDLESGGITPMPPASGRPSLESNDNMEQEDESNGPGSPGAGTPRSSVASLKPKTKNRGGSPGAKSRSSVSSVRSKQSKGKSKARAKSVMLGNNSASSSSLSQNKRHSHGTKVARQQSPQQQRFMSESERLAPISDKVDTASSRSCRTVSDLEVRLESQRMLDEGAFYDPQKTKSTASDALSSTIHGSGISSAAAKKQVSNKTSLDSKSAHGLPTSLYAAEAAAKARSSLQEQMTNQSERVHRRRAQQTDANNNKPKPGNVTFFGNPLLPIDIVGKMQKLPKLNLMHHKDALQVLGSINSMKRQQLNVKMESTNASTAALPLSRSLTNPSSSNNETPSEDGKAKTELKVIQLLKTAGTAASATLSMTGFKGGDPEDQINHDRSLIVAPFYLRNHSNSMVRRRLIGVFDGHAEHGCRFAEHCQQLLPSLLSRKLSEEFKRAVEDISAGIKTGEDEVAITKRVLIESFVIMDESSPREATGGCTATVVYQQGQKVFIANTGDSRSFIAVYRKNHPHIVQHQKKEKGGSPKQSKSPKSMTADDTPTVSHTKVVYMSREDKPDLVDERTRLEGWGGEIIPAEKNKSAKVRFQAGRSGKISATLSMSRSIGDWQFTPLGVIADPIVDVLDLKELVENEMSSDGDDENNDDDVCVFAVCVSDGMMIESNDEAEVVASELATSLFSDDGHYPLSSCQHLITRTAAVWDKRNKGKFRDDITIAVTVLRAPSSSGD